MDELEQRLRAALEGSPVLWSVIQNAERLDLADYYIGAGCIAQTVWNCQNDLPPLHGISDIDLAYYDGEDLSWEGENAVICRARALFGALPLSLDVKNQARVHLWYGEKFGKDIEPYSSLEAAIRTWPTSSTAVGVRLRCGELSVFAPFGLEDLFSQRVRPNRVQVSQADYEKKCARWGKMWDTLTFEKW